MGKVKNLLFEYEERDFKKSAAIYTHGECSRMFDRSGRQKANERSVVDARAAFDDTTSTFHILTLQDLIL